MAGIVSAFSLHHVTLPRIPILSRSEAQAKALRTILSCDNGHNWPEVSLWFYRSIGDWNSWWKSWNFQIR